MKNRNEYCPFCHILVAPAARDRLERGGQATHEGCVRRNGYDAAYTLCWNFLSGRGASFEASALEIKASRANTPRLLAKLVGYVLTKYAEKLGPQEKAAAADCAAQVADKLYIDVVVDGAPRAPTPRTNGKGTAKHA